MKSGLTILLILLSVKCQGQNTLHSETWLVIRNDCKVSYMDPSGKIRLVTNHEYASSFHEGRAFVWSFPGYDKDRENVPLGEEYINHEQINLKGNRLTGIIDSTGKYVVEPRQNFEFHSHFQDGVALVRIDNEIQFIGKNGKVIKPFDPVFSEKQIQNVLRVSQYEKTLPMRYCYVDASRTPKIVAFEEARGFSENRAAVRLGMKFGYISRDGEMKILPQFKHAGYFTKGHATVSIAITKQGRESYLYGVIDSNGRFVIPPIYDYLGDPSDGHIVYAEGNGDERKYGLLDMKGNKVILARYTTLGTYSDGLMSVQSGKKYGYMNLKEKMIVKPKFSFAAPFKHGVARVQIGANKAAIINLKGDYLWGPHNKSQCE